MKKSPFYLLTSSISLVFTLFCLHCVNFDSPNAPEKTKISAVFKASSSKMYETSLVDSVGKEIWIGAALYLPGNFDSVQMSLIDNGSTVTDTVFKTFKSEYYYDTVWLKHTFWSPDIKNLTITPFSVPERAAITTTITIQGVTLENAAPKWSVDTLRKTTRIGTPLLVSLFELCTDTENGLITFTLFPGAPENDTVIGTAYQFNPTLQTVGTYVAQIRASDPAGNHSILPVKISVDTTTEDKTAPEISMVSPSDTNVIITTDSFTVDLLCSDRSGVASICAVMGATTFPSILKNGHHTIKLTGLTNGQVNIVTLKATDSSATANTVSRNLYFNYQTSAGFSVTYQKGADVTGSLPVDTRKYQNNEQVIVLGNTGNLVKSGFTFSGWNTKEDGSGVSYTGGSNFLMGNADVVLFAQWTKKPTFTVTYNGNGNTSGTVPIDANNYETGATVTVRGNTGALVKSESTFAGWNTAADGSGTAYAAGTTFPIASANMTLYAVWTSKPTFTVTYNGNTNTSGTIPADPNTYDSGTTVTVKENTGLLTKTGSTFTGWNTAADGSGTAYAAGAIFPMGSANVTLYAQWTLIPTFTVTYIGNGNTGGAVPIDTTGYVSGSTVLIKSNADVTNGTPIAKTGHTFIGWNTNSLGSGKTYRGDGTDTLNMPSATVTLYAKWVIDTFTVTFISTGATVFQTQRIAYNGQATLPTTQPILAGNSFDGWFTTNDASGVSFDFSLPITANRTLYAKWTPVYSVIYQANGGSGSVPADSKKYKSGESVTVLDNTGGLAKTDNDFAGWTLNAQGTGTVYNAGDRITVASVDIIFYAKWMCTVTFNSQSATIAPSPASKKINSSTAIGTLPTDPQKTSYVFDGWYTNLSDQSTKVNAATIFNKNITVYAKWVIKDADGNIYTEVKIGNQVWMVENLKTTKFNTGISIPNVPDSADWWNATTPAYCWYDNNPTNKTPFGALYNWYTVNTGILAPKGWHVPNNDDWNQLITFAGGENIAGSHLKDTILWGMPDVGKEDNETGFSALPGGGRYAQGSNGSKGFLGQPGGFGLWWSSNSYDDTSAYECDMALYNQSAYLSELFKKIYGCSVRCIRDY